MMASRTGSRTWLPGAAFSSALAAAALLLFWQAPGRGEEAAMPDPETARISVDFSRWVDYPLVKSKIALYNSGYVPGALKTYRRDGHLMDEVRPGSLRFDGGLGSPPGIILSDPPLLSGEPPRLKFDFRQADALVDLLAAHDVRPYWCYSYVPPALSSGRPDFRNPPRDMDEWARALAAVAGHFRRTGRQIAFHEIYNEPDNRDFFRGSLSDYLAMYEHGAKAIRAADPDARVGGPSLAFTESWIRPFLEHVTRNALPLDFFSFHFYPGVPYSAKDVRGVVEMVRRELGRYPQLATAEMHLNEYNSLPIDYPEDGPQQKHALAADLLNDFAYFVSQPCLTSVHWAQFMDTGGGNWSGLVSIDGWRKAAFNALALYARMPVDRRKAEIDAPDGIGAMASSDGHTCAAVVWNRSGSARAVRMEMNGVPFQTGDLRVYRIDAGHASRGDGSEQEGLAAVEERRGCAMKDAVWEGTVPSGGVLYIEAGDGSGISGLARCEAGRVLHVLHHFPDRNSPSYADFDRQTWTARLGMAGDGSGRAEVGVLAEDLPAEVDVAVEMDGKMSPGGLLGVRLDYLSDDGWKSSVLFHSRADGGDTGLALPWGTRRKADRQVRVPDFSRFRIRPGEHAPEGWTGRVLMTFLLQRAGTDARAKIAVRRSE